MKFLDQAKIYITSGKGGHGCVSFRREKFVEFGGPNGGNGGKGGNVVALAVNNLNTLIDFRYQQHIKAKNGRPGMGNSRTGADGKHIDNYVLAICTSARIAHTRSAVFGFDMLLIAEVY